MADYPKEFQLDIVVRDGEVVQVRPIKPTDGPLLVDFFERLGPESRYFRFFRVKQTLPPEEVEYFTNVDYRNRMALVALVGGVMVGVGRYDRLQDEPTIGEVAFAVADDHQGRGIGTELVGLLTAHARRNGIAGFRAFVLPENVQMMRVFRNSGFELKRTVESGIYALSFPVAFTADARAAAEERERRAVAASVLPLLFPRSIAVVGASTKKGSIGNTLMHNLISEGFSGPVYPVNPTTQVVNSVRAYASVLDIPDAVDLAFIVVPAGLALQAARECAEKGVRGLVVITAGFSEIGGDGEQLEAELLDIVRDAGMRMVGPNCMGLLNTAMAVNMNGTFAPTYPPPGNIAMSSQSGALGVAILDYARRNRLGISQFVSVGNKADIAGNDLLLAWEDDPATDVILLYLESFGNARRFARAARRIARKKPIVAVKSGRTAAGSRAASSHTGALASLDIAVDALFDQSGVIRVETLEEMFAVGALLANQPIPKGPRVGIVTNAGGPAILATDALESRGLQIPESSPELRAKLAEWLPKTAATRNPVDLIAGADAEQYRHVLPLMLESGEFDSVLAIYVPTSNEGVASVGSAIHEVAVGYEGDCTLLSVFMQAEQASEYLVGGPKSVPVFQFPEGAAMALARATRHGEWLQRDPGTVKRPDGIDAAEAKTIVARAIARFGDEGGWLEADEVAGVLRCFGIDLPKSATVHSAEDAVAAAEEIGGPVALKVQSPTALHKSDVGGVALGITGDAAVRAAYQQVMEAVPDPEGVLVQEMVPGGHEILIGVTEDPNFGPLIGFGLGGVFVELLKDVAFRLHPLTDVDAAEMIAETKGSALLRGYRNSPPGDVVALQDAILRVSDLVGEIPEVVEMDLNPVKVLAPGSGVRAVDARMKVAPVREWHALELEELPSIVSGN